MYQFIVTRPTTAIVTATLLGVAMASGLNAAAEEKKGYWRMYADEPVSSEVIQSTRHLRERLLADPYRPGYHFCVPEDIAAPGDPNGCFYAKGRYHLMYLYNRTGGGFSWGHLSSIDLVHWRHHPDSLAPGEGDEGAFSGGAFVDDDGTVYLSYWMLWGAKGIGLARSTEPHYSQWEKFETNPVIPSTEWGITETTGADGKRLIYGSADPSNIWKHDGKYYMVTGNLLVLNKYGRKDDAPLDQQGDRLYLFKSENLKDWQYKGVFYQRNPDWTDRSEDNMCPSFLPLPSRPDGGKPSGKHLMLFISHNKGCQYYIGDYDTKQHKFLPTRHGRMTWKDSYLFAPEALVDDRGRQIMWTWLRGNPREEPGLGWFGVYSLPRSLWLGEDGQLRMQPVQELELLRYNGRDWNEITLDQGEEKTLDGVNGTSFELKITIDAESAGKVGVKVLASPGGEQETMIYYDAENKKLVYDASRSGYKRRRSEQAPFALKPGEPLTLRVFVDKSIVEVFANDRQGLCREAYPDRADSVHVKLFARGGAAKIAGVKAWEMMPSSPY